MSYSKARTPTFNLKKIYNVWRMASLGLDLAGLVLFLFSLGMGDLMKPMMVVSMIILWVGVYVSYRYVKIEEGKPFEPVAKVSYTISMALALVISVLTAITLLNG